MEHGVKATHITVTRNPRSRAMFELYRSPARFPSVIQPFPGNVHAVPRSASSILVTMAHRTLSTTLHRSQRRVLPDTPSD